MHIHTVTYLRTYLASSQLNLSPAGLIIQLQPVNRGNYKNTALTSECKVHNKGTKCASVYEYMHKPFGKHS